MKTSASYTITMIYDGDQLFVKWGTSSSNTTVPTLFTDSEPSPSSTIFIWRKEGHGITVDDATWGNPVCLTGATGATGAQGSQGNKGDKGINGVDAIGLGYLINHSALTSPDDGEVYFHGYTNGVASNVNGWIWLGDKKVTITQGYVNPGIADTFYLVAPIVGGEISIAKFDTVNRVFRDLSDVELSNSTYFVLGTMVSSTIEYIEDVNLYSRGRSINAVALELGALLDVRQPVFLGSVSIVPTDNSVGFKILKGDYFLWNDVTSGIYIKGNVYEYNGTDFELSTNGNLIMNIFDSFASLANDSENTVIGNSVIKKLVSTNAFIDNLYTHNATISSVLKTSNYNEINGIPTSGFQIDGPKSVVKMYEALFGSNCTFYGKLLHPLLKTRESVIGDTYTITPKTHWAKQSLLNFFTSQSMTSNALVSCTGTYDGQAITHVINATQTNIRLFTSTSSNPLSYTVPFKLGSTYLYACANTYRYEGEIAYIKLNGVIQVNSDTTHPTTKTIITTKGDVLLADAMPSSVLLYADLVLPSSGCYVILSDGTIVKLDDYSNKQLSLTYGGTTWNSSSYINYVAGSVIISLLSSISKGITLGATGVLVVDSITKSINSLFSEISSVTLNWDSINSMKIFDTGYYDISGNFTPQSVISAVLTDTILPIVNADDEGNGKDIGTSVSKYRDIFSKTINCDVVNGDNLFAQGQSWQDTTDIRERDTIYTNSTDRPILIAVRVFFNSSSGYEFYIDDEIISSDASSASQHIQFTVVVPSGSTWEITFDKSTDKLSAVHEFR